MWLVFSQVFSPCSCFHWVFSRGFPDVPLWCLSATFVLFSASSGKSFHFLSSWQVCVSVLYDCFWMFGSLFSTLSPSFVERKKKNASEPKVRFSCWGQVSLWSQFPSFMSGRGSGYHGVIASLMSLIEVAQFYYFLIWVCYASLQQCIAGFSVHSMHFHDVISDWRLIPVRDWVVCSLLAWFYLPVLFGGAPIVSFLLRFSWRFDLLCLDTIFVHCVLLCFFGLSVLHFREIMCSNPCRAEFCLWFLECILCWAGFCVPVFMNCLDGMDSTGVSQVSWAPEVGIVMNRHFRRTAELR